MLIHVFSVCCLPSPNQVVALHSLSGISKVSRPLRRPPCLLGNCCGWTPPPPPLLHSDLAKRGVEGRSLWRHWCTVAGSSVESVSHCCLLPRSSWRTGMSRRRWSNTGDTVRWTGSARFEPGGGCSPDRAEAGRCDTSLPEWSPWLSPW